MKTTVLFFLSFLCQGAFGQNFFWSYAGGTSPIVNTTAITLITATSASGGGNVTSAGRLTDGSIATVSSRGICWGTSSNPTTANSKTSDGTGTGIFTSSITGVTIGTLYYVRAYAINNIVTAYGSNVTFTPQGLPTVITNPITNISYTSATGGGNVTSDGGGTVSTRGVCYAYSTNPTTANYKTAIGSGTGTFSGSMTTGIAADWKMYAKAYATNGAGTAYGNEVTFITPCNAAPELNQIGFPNRPWQAGTAVVSSQFTSANATEVGICYNTTGSPTIADPHTNITPPKAQGTVNITINGLTSGQSYYFSAFAVSPCGTTYYPYGISWRIN